jgi:hypothetical protein
VINRSCSLLAVLALSASGLDAAELVIRDLRLSAGTLPASFDYALSAPTVDASGTDAFEAALGLEAGGRWSFARAGDPLGLVVGGDLLLDGSSYQGSDGLATTAARLSAGLGWALNDRLTTTAEVGYMYGVSALSLPDTVTAPAFSATGTMSGYDLRVGGTWLATRRFGIGGYLGWLVSSHDLSGDDITLTIDQSGWFVGLEAVWRFTDAPTTLE